MNISYQEIINKYESIDDLLEKASPEEIEVYIQNTKPQVTDNFRDEKYW